MSGESGGGAEPADLPPIGTEFDPIGAGFARREDERLTTGRGNFADDLRRDGMVHAAFVRSEVPHARIEELNAARALEVEGVVAIMTAGNLPPESRAIPADSTLEGLSAAPIPVLADDRVLYVGQPIAVVLGRDRYSAEDGASAIDVTYEPLPPVPDLLTARDGAETLHPDVPGNVYLEFEETQGDVDAAFADAHQVIELELAHQRVSPMPLEGRVMIAEFTGENGTVWVTSQAPHMLRTGLARTLGLAESSLRLISRDVGGGFGAKLALYPEYVAVCVASMQLKRPVKWTADRQEEFLTGTHARELTHRIRAAVDAGGRVLGLEVDIAGDSGAFSIWPQTAVLEAVDSGESLTGPYDVDVVRKRVAVFATNKSPTGPYRGVGRVMACFTMERLMDAVAGGLELDPLDVRERNVIKKFPHKTAGGLELDSGSYLESIKLARKRLGYDEIRRDLRGQQARERRRGLGVVIASEPSAFGQENIGGLGIDAMVGYEVATLEVGPRGEVVVQVGSHSHGQGHETTFAQITASELGVPIETVSVRFGDTDAFAFAGGTWASRSTVMGGGAIRDAARDVSEKIREIGAEILEADIDDVEFANGKVRVVGAPSHSIDLEMIARRAHHATELLPAGVEPGLCSTRAHRGPEPSTVSNMLHSVEVEVDLETGGVEILRYFAIEDCGTIINPKIVDGQVLGGLAQGIGQALHEEMSYDTTGQPVSTTLLDYGIPGSLDVPDVEIEHLVSPSPRTAHGAKGVGEGGTIPPPAALAAAIDDALSPFDVSVTRMPITPAWIVEQIKSNPRHGS